MYDHGSPIRSSEINNALKNADSNIRTGMNKIGESVERLQMLNLALRATPSSRPVTLLPGEELLPLQTNLGTEKIGDLCVTSRTESVPAMSLDSNPPSLWSVPETGVIGEKHLFDEKAIWARLSNTPSDQYTVALQPAYNSDYNEVIIPAIAGQASVTLSSSKHEDVILSASNRTSVYRFANTKSFSGAATINITASSGLEGKYIHTLGGLFIRRSSWETTGYASVTWTAPEAGTYDLTNIKFWSGINNLTKTPRLSSDRISVYEGQTGLDPALVVADAGDSFTIRILMNWQDAASHIKLIATRVV